MCKNEWKYITIIRTDLKGIKVCRSYIKSQESVLHCIGNNNLGTFKGTVRICFQLLCQAEGCCLYLLFVSGNKVSSTGRTSEVNDFIPQNKQPFVPLLFVD